MKLHSTGREKQPPPLPRRLNCHVGRQRKTVTQEIQELTSAKLRDWVTKSLSDGAMECLLDTFQRWAELQFKQGRGRKWATVNEAWLDYRTGTDFPC